MPLPTKQSALIYLSVSLLAMLLLAASLPGLELKAGNAFPGGGLSTGGGAAQTEQAVAKVPSVSLLQGIFALLFLGLLFYIPARLALRLDFKKVGGPVVLLLLLLILLIILPRLVPEEAAMGRADPIDSQQTAEPEIPVSPLGTPPPVFTWLVLGGAAIGAGVLVFSLLKRQPERPAPQDEIRQEAAAAVDALRAGEDFDDVIIRCYLRMVYVLQEERGMRRGDDMTAREFECLLESRGVPNAPVHQLTRLFEKVRYGRQPASDADQRQGLESLEQIIGFSRENGTVSR